MNKFFNFYSLLNKLFFIALPNNLFGRARHWIRPLQDVIEMILCKLVLTEWIHNENFLLRERNTEGMKLLDDKSSLAKLKPLYEKYSSEFSESMYEASPGEYEDEYDDTYDANEVGADDADSADELLARRYVGLTWLLTESLRMLWDCGLCRGGGRGRAKCRWSPYMFSTAWKLLQSSQGVHHSTNPEWCYC